jgi:phosphate starvation-inducible PhoH-like protein
MLPLFEKCEELLSRSDFKVLVKDKSLEYATTCFMRGRTFNDSIVIIDESQNLTMKEFLTIFTRIGRNSKLIFVGDTAQSDISISDFSKVYQ